MRYELEEWAVRLIEQESLDRPVPGRIVELGGSIVSPPEDTPYGRLATATDPVGVQFKLVQGNQGQG